MVAGKKPKARGKSKAKGGKAPAKKRAARNRVPKARKKPVRKAAARRAPAAKAAPAAKPMPAAKPAARPVPRPAAAAPGPAVPAKPKPAPVAAEAAPPGERIGVVTHYYSHLSVAVVRLETGTLRVGDTIRIRGHTSDFTQRVESMQVDHAPVTEVGPNREFGLKVIEHAREHDVVYRVRP